MLAAEARWFRDRLAAWPAERLFPLCNVGSAAGEGQLREQPWIERDVFGPLKRLPGARILNCDLFPGAGVDLVGDLTEPAFRERLAELGVRAIFCANVLEHVPEPERLAAGLSALLPPGGLMFVSVPQAFPYHPDPIDTLFRPTPAELNALFPDLRPLTAESVAAGTLAGYVGRRLVAHPGALFGTILKKLVRGKPHRAAEEIDAAVARKAPPAPPPSTWKTHLPWLFKTLRVACAVLEKP